MVRSTRWVFLVCCLWYHTHITAINPMQQQQHDATTGVVFYRFMSHLEDSWQRYEFEGETTSWGDMRDALIEKHFSASQNMLDAFLGGDCSNEKTPSAALPPATNLCDNMCLVLKRKPISKERTRGSTSNALCPFCLEKGHLGENCPKKEEMVPKRHQVATGIPMTKLRDATDEEKKSRSITTYLLPNGKIMILKEKEDTFQKFAKHFPSRNHDQQQHNTTQHNTTQHNTIYNFSHKT